MMDVQQISLAYNSTFLKNLSGNIERKVIWVHHTFNKAQVSWKLQPRREENIW